MTEDVIDLNALEKQMDSVNAQIEELKRQNIETSKRVFQGAIASFFKAYPEVAAITWTQYTPYFNDGDTCEFSVADPSFLSIEDVENDERSSYYECNSSWDKPSDYAYRNPNTYKDEIEKYEKLEATMGTRLEDIQKGTERFLKMFRKISDDTMLSLFGDHVRITATPTGITVDEYDHE